MEILAFKLLFLIILNSNMKSLIVQNLIYSSGEIELLMKVKKVRKKLRKTLPINPLEMNIFIPILIKGVIKI